MGNWFSKSEKKKTENVSENLVKKNNNSPKKPKYGFLKKAPDFYFLFNSGLKGKNRNTDKNLMVKYEIVNEDLDENNLADVFIDRIIKNDKIEDKIKALQELDSKLFNIKSREISKNTSSEIKKAIFIIKDNYTKYEDKIKKRIVSVKPAANANAAANPAANTGVAKPAANAAANAGVANPAANPAANANPTSGGSRKKSKKSRS